MIRFTHDTARKVLFTNAEGLVSFTDIKCHLSREASEGALPCRELFDASAACTDVTQHEVRELAGHISTLAKNGSLGPTAIVTQNDVFFGMARMFQILSELQGGPSFGVFRKRDEALEWLLRIPPGPTESR